MNVTAESAEQFAGRAEEALARASVDAQRAAWVAENFITHDTQILAAQANEAQIRLSVALAKEAAKFDGDDRKIKLIKLALTSPGPSDPAKTAELARIAAELDAMYGTAKCGDLDINAIAKIMRESRDPDRLLDVWRGWHLIAPPMRERYTRFVALMNEGARELGFADTGVLWRSKYDMEPDAFEAEMERLWTQVEPLYDLLHRFVRKQLARHYGEKIVAPDRPLPAHLFGNIWAQEWGNIYDVVAPEGLPDRGYDLTAILSSRPDLDELAMVRLGEHFFTSLGFDPLPQTFWERSLFVKPRDREVVCHASAWDIDDVDDLRIKMCIEKTEEDLTTIHHELGHNFYQRAYNRQPFLYRNSANDAFHEAIGDTIALSVTPAYLKEIGLIEKEPPPEADIALLLREALDKIAFLPFGMMMDRWRWRVFAGAENYNELWWELRADYQCVAPFGNRGEEFFDPGAKYHIAANVPYARYFLARILQFQFHRALCRTAGYGGPLNRGSIYGNQKAGARLARALEMGASRPWPDALEALTGERQMDATALVEYFQPLVDWMGSHL